MIKIFHETTFTEDIKPFFFNKEVISSSLHLTASMFLHEKKTINYLYMYFSLVY